MHPGAPVLTPAEGPRRAPSTVLVVEDNAISMKMVRLALTSAGYSVLEAPNGRTALELAGVQQPDLILQDLKLPDMDGIDLLDRLRRLPGGDAVPILALSGFQSQLESLRMVQGGFTDYLCKPVETSLLLSIVQAYLEPVAEPLGPPGARRRILLADDDPVQLNLSKMHLAQAGFDVSTAIDGREALEQARRLTPAAVVSDVLMPNLDGFRLCMALKQDARLAGIRVVLTSSAFTEAADLDLARRVGADALVNRSPDQKEMIQALQTSLSGVPAPRPAIPAELPVDLYAGRITRQVERQAQLVTRLTRRLALLQVEVGIQSAASVSISASEPGERVLQALLQNCLNACGYSRGAIYLKDRNGRLVPVAAFGFADSAGQDVAGFFGHPDLLRDVLEGDRHLIVPGPRIPEARAQTLLAQSGMHSIVCNAIRPGGERLGVFWMGSDRRVSEEAEVQSIAAAISAQIAQALALTQSFANVTRAGEEYRSIFEDAVEGIFELGAEERVINANPALARILGFESSAELLVQAPRLPSMLAEPGRAVAFEASVRGGNRVAGFETALRRRDGETIRVVISGGAVRREGRIVRQFLGFLKDVTEEVPARELNRQEETRRLQLQIMDQFLSRVSHELRTPVAVIHQFVTILLDGLAGTLTPEQREHLSVVLRNAGDLRAMIDGLLEATRVDRPSFTILPGRVSVIDVVSEAIGALEVNARAKGVGLGRDLPTDLPPVDADGSCVGQILTNLIGNAIKCTPAGGSVTVRAQVVSNASHAVRIAVADTGSGSAFFFTLPVYPEAGASGPT